MTRFKGCFSLRASTCLFVFTLCGRITGALNERVKVVVKEDSDAILPCSLSTKEDIESKLFDWKKDGQKEVFLYNAGLHYNNGHSDQQDRQFKGRVFHFQDELQHGNASIIIRDTTMADSGDYTCVLPLLQPSQTFHIELVVDGIFKDRRMINFPGAASEPSVTILDQTKDGMKLLCEVRGVSPKTKVESKDSSGKIVPVEKPKIAERGGSYDIILEAPVTKTDHYRCVVTQKEIYHQVYAEVYLHFTGSSTGWIVAVSVLSILLVLVVGGVLYVKYAYEIIPKKSRWRPEKGSGKPPVSHHENGVSLRTKPLLSGSDVPA